MRWMLTLLGLALVVAFAGWAYGVKYKAQDALSRVEALRDDIAREKETISVLRAEWAYLNRPERLRMLTEKYFDQLGLMPIHAEHFADPAVVAFPPADVDEIMEVIEAIARETSL